MRERPKLNIRRLCIIKPVVSFDTATQAWEEIGIEGSEEEVGIGDDGPAGYFQPKL